MGIAYADGIFHLQSRHASYLFCIVQNRFVCHLYWGPRLRTTPDIRALAEEPAYPRSSFSPRLDEESPDGQVSPDDLQLEFASFGGGDYRAPSFYARYADGSTVGEWTYAGYAIAPGKPALAGLPATYAESDGEASTLTIELTDKKAGLRAFLSYTVFEDCDAIARSVRYENAGGEPVELLSVQSACVDFPDMDYKLLHLYGVWAGERDVDIRPLSHGMQGISSARGMSGHADNPFIALLSSDATEDRGDVWGFSLVYSGNFSATCEVNAYERSRVMLGINPFEFGWKLSPGESFQTPEAVLVYSGEGLGGMSRIYHRLYRERLCRGRHRDALRPTLANNWEGTYFRFDEEKLLGIARAAKEAGIELFVLDDGWFGKRDNDRSSLGDWVVNERKLPGGISGLSEKVHGLGLLFGLWFEPEMISPDSDLYRAHPDWCLHVEGRRRTTARHQLVLDLSRADVRDYIVDAVCAAVRSARIDYIKWDCNRNFTESGSALLPAGRQQELAHRYVLGLYEVLERITGAFPDILFESCSGGGGRFDPGMLYYMPQTWTSDNTDAWRRIFIQYGTSIVYPAVTMGAHVSVERAGTSGRHIPVETRAAVAMSGNFGLELDLTKLSGEELAAIGAQVALSKRFRALVQHGDLYRLESPYGGKYASWEFVSEDRSEAAAFFFQLAPKFDGPERRVRLRGLLPDGRYEDGDGRVYTGETLMNVGLRIPYQASDYASEIRSFRLLP